MVSRVMENYQFVYLEEVYAWDSLPKPRLPISANCPHLAQFAEKLRQTVLRIRQIGFRQTGFRQTGHNPPPPFAETQFAVTKFAESVRQFADFFRQTGQGRNSLPNSANWVSANCPIFRIFAQFAETQFAETQFADSEGQFAELFFGELVKVGTVCRIRQTGFRQTVPHS